MITFTNWKIVMSILISTAGKGDHDHHHEENENQAQ